MKLDCGQSIAPVPWPIHNSPMTSATRPTIRSSLLMDFPCAGGALSIPDRFAGIVRRVRKTVARDNRSCRSDIMPAGPARADAIAGLSWAAGRSYGSWRLGDRVRRHLRLLAAPGGSGRLLSAGHGSAGNCDVAGLFRKGFAPLGSFYNG